MNKVFLVALISIFFVVTGFAYHQVSDSCLLTDSKQESKVYVCGGKYSTKLHSHSNCRGLNNCKGGVFTYESQSAAKRAGYKYCLICWD